MIIIPDKTYPANAIGATSLQGNQTSNQETQAHNNRAARIVEDKVEISSEALDAYEASLKARNEAQNALTEKIMSKGFLDWAEEVNREKLEAEVRAQVLSSMGYSEEDYATLEAEVQQRIEQIIKEKIEEKIEEELAKKLKESNPENDQFANISFRK
ncbi:hypothetical protein [Pseudemcibacter aquimaris]|uniref:hypothetical protein n=1 Tax=Pseudemcibacter aquimaris TaxID=2857064 RepID=UPI002013943E|nr:hypothetical protein [Pseudemcibacter aquimaris]MCC3861245.1 hypothetical protein [Pseudemcibacter aquimaris]WDU58019.1 hypothetical protein KW060_12545 [Pseudemcibacter aquimaris]